MSTTVKHYMRLKDASKTYDLESDDFKGLLYSKCTGLDDKGQRMDVYTEEYADSDKLRYWLGGDKPKRKPTTITLTLFFTGDKRHDTYESFYNFIKSGVIEYWDTWRLKKATMYLSEAVKVNDEQQYGSIPYKEVKVTFQNIYGECFPCDANGENI